MKKILLLIMAVAMSFSLVACSSTNADDNEGESPSEETVTISVSDAEGNPVDVEFPVAPKKVVVLNYQTLDFLDAMGLGDSVVGFIKDTKAIPDHLKKYVEDEDIVNVGSIHEPDFEAIASLEPDVIFSSDRSRKLYDDLSAIAPTMAAFINYSDGFFTSYKELAANHSAIFGIGEEVDKIVNGYEERIEAINEEFSGTTALLGIFADGLNTLGNVGRCSVIVTDMGFTNLAGDDDVNHGNKSSYEVFLELNPEYMFILDRDTAVGQDAVAAKQQMDNDIIKQTDAYKNDKIIYLEPAKDWYVCDGGITAMGAMLDSLEEDLGM